MSRDTPRPGTIYVWLVPSEDVLDQPGSWRIRKWDLEPFPEANFAASERGAPNPHLETWVKFSLANGETADGVMHRALVNIASISPLSTAAPQEIARNALAAADALAEACTSDKPLHPGRRPALRSDQPADAWLIERPRGTGKQQTIEREVVLSPLTDDTFMDEGDVAWPLYRTVHPSAITAPLPPLDVLKAAALLTFAHDPDVRCIASYIASLCPQIPNAHDPIGNAIRAAADSRGTQK